MVLCHGEDLLPFKMQFWTLNLLLHALVSRNLIKSSEQFNWERMSNLLGLPRTERKSLRDLGHSIPKIGKFLANQNKLATLI